MSDSEKMLKTEISEILPILNNPESDFSGRMGAIATLIELVNKEDLIQIEEVRKCLLKLSEQLKVENGDGLNQNGNFTFNLNVAELDVYQTLIGQYYAFDSTSTYLINVTIGSAPYTITFDCGNDSIQFKFE